MADQTELEDQFNERLLFLLKHDDLKGAAEHINQNRGRLQRFQINKTYLPDQTYNKLGPIEIAIKFGDTDLFDACNRFGGYQALQNNRGFSLDYWALLHNFKLPSSLTMTYGHGYKNTSYQGTSFDPLVLAVANGHLHILDKLIKSSKSAYDMDFTTSKRNLFEIAALYDRAEVLRELIEMSILKAKQSIWTHRCDMGNVLHIAARLGHVRIAKVLIQLTDPTPEELEERDDFDHTAMSLAVLHLHAPVVELLAKSGATMKGEFGYKKETLFDIIFSSDAELRQEYLIKDKTMRDRVILLLAEHNPEELAKLSKERLAYIEDVKQHFANCGNVQEVEEEAMVEDEAVLPLGPESDDDEEENRFEAHPSPSGKKKLPECTLCDKKFTSEISLQAHLKSKGHAKQEKKQRVQKKFEVLTPEKTMQKQQEMIGLIERLPLLSELINLIIIKLDKWSLLKFSTTSKSIQMLVEKRNSVWRKIDLYITRSLWDDSKGRVFEPIKRVLPLVEKLKYCTTDSIWELKKEMLSTIFDIPKYCPNLRELDIRVLDVEVPVSFLSALFQGCPKLRVLKLNRVLEWKTSKKEAVESGGLDAPQGEQPEPAVNPKKPWKKKKAKKTKRQDPKAWAVRVDEVLLHSSNSLEEFSLVMRFPDNLPAESFTKIVLGIVKKCPNLLQLRVEAQCVEKVPSSILKSFVDSVIESLPKLRSLKLMGEWLFGRLPLPDYNALFQKFNKLDKLQLEGSEIMSFDRDIHDALGDCTNLKELVICHNGEVNVDGPRIGLSNLTNLTKLGFYSWNEPATPHWDQMLHTITATCTKIQHLEVALSWNDRLAQGMAPIAPQLKVFKQKLWLGVGQPPFSTLVKCSNLTLLHAVKISLSDFHTVIEHCKFLETINVDIYPSEVQPLPDDNNDNNNNDNAANANNNNNAQPVDGEANANNNNNENPDPANNNENNNANAVAPNENNNNEANNNDANANVAPANNNEANNNNGNNNNNNAAVVAQAPAWNVVDLGRVLDKCRNLKHLHLQGPINAKTFTNFVVSTSLKRVTQFVTDERVCSDMIIFYFSECCPNLEYLSTDYTFYLSEWMEVPFTRRFPHLNRFKSNHAYSLDQAFFNANKERAAKIRYNLL